MFSIVLDALFPPRSLRGVPGMLITPDEQKDMKPVPVRMDTNRLRSAGSIHLDELVAGCMLDESPLVRAALHRFKYRRVRMLGDALVHHLLEAEKLLSAHDAILCPVPLHWTRLCSRGFNQSHELACCLSSKTGYEVSPLLRRRRPTGTQTKRSREERLHAMQGVFTIRGNQMPSHVILIDDVATTLATLDACASVLKRAGVNRVDALVVALG